MSRCPGIALLTNNYKGFYGSVVSTGAGATEASILDSVPVGAYLSFSAESVNDCRMKPVSILYLLNSQDSFPLGGCS